MRARGLLGESLGGDPLALGEPVVAPKLRLAPATQLVWRLRIERRHRRRQPVVVESDNVT